MSAPGLTAAGLPWGMDLHQLTPAKWVTLQALAERELRGTTALTIGLLNGGALAALVQFGLAERFENPADRVGGAIWYRITTAGFCALSQRPAAAQRPRGASATMAHRDLEADETDFFPSQPWGGRAGAELIRELDPQARSAWDPACGALHLVHGFRDYFERVEASDLHDYVGNVLFDFVRPAHRIGEGRPPPFEADWIFSNPPFAPAAAFVRQALALAGRGVAMLVRSGFEESVGRYDLLHGPQGYAVRAPFAERLPLVKGRYDPRASSAAAYSWILWLKPSVRSPAARTARHVRARFGMGLDRAIPPGTRQRLTRASDAQFAVREG